MALVSSSKSKTVPPCGPIAYNTQLFHYWAYSGPVRHGKETQKLCKLIFSCLHDIIFVLLNLMQLGLPITSFIPTILYSFFSSRVKLVIYSAECKHPCLWASASQQKTVIEVFMTNKQKTVQPVKPHNKDTKQTHKHSQNHFTTTHCCITLISQYFSGEKSW